MSLSLRIRDLSLQIMLPGTPTQTSYGYSALRSHNVSQGNKKELHHSFFVPAMSHDQLSQPNSTEKFFPAKFLSNGNVAPRGNVTSLNIGHEGRRKFVSCLGNRSSQIFVIYFRDFSQPFIDRFHNKGTRSSQIGK